MYNYWNHAVTDHNNNIVEGNEIACNLKPRTKLLIDLKPPESFDFNHIRVDKERQQLAFVDKTRGGVEVYSAYLDQVKMVLIDRTEKMIVIESKFRELPSVSLELRNRSVTHAITGRYLGDAFNWFVQKICKVFKIKIALSDTISIKTEADNDRSWDEMNTIIHADECEEVEAIRQEEIVENDDDHDLIFKFDDLVTAKNSKVVDYHNVKVDDDAKEDENFTFTFDEEYFAIKFKQEEDMKDAEYDGDDEETLIDPDITLTGEEANFLIKREFDKTVKRLEKRIISVDDDVDLNALDYSNITIAQVDEPVEVATDCLMDQELFQN